MVVSEMFHPERGSQRVGAVLPWPGACWAKLPPPCEMIMIIIVMMIIINIIIKSLLGQTATILGEFPIYIWFTSRVFENENAISCLVQLSVQDKSIESHTSRSVEPLVEPWSTACL